MNIRTILEELMAGKFICPVTNETAFNYLSSTRGFEQINTAIAPFERELIQLPDNSAFHLVATNLENKADKISIRKHFEECRDIIEPIVSFLVLISRVKPKVGILTSGLIVRYPELLSAIADNEHHLQQMNNLMTLKLFKTSKQGTDDKLKAIFKGMIDVELIVEKNAADLTYQVSGKIDYFYSVMQFIADHESIDTTETAQDQSELVL
jgi:hypothetical protein